MAPGQQASAAGACPQGGTLCPLSLRRDRPAGIRPVPRSRPLAGLTGTAEGTGPRMTDAATVTVTFRRGAIFLSVDMPLQSTTEVWSRLQQITASICKLQEAIGPMDAH